MRDRTTERKITATLLLHTERTNGLNRASNKKGSRKSGRRKRRYEPAQNTKRCVGPDSPDVHTKTYIRRLSKLSLEFLIHIILIFLHLHRGLSLLELFLEKSHDAWSSVLQDLVDDLEDKMMMVSLARDQSVWENSPCQQATSSLGHIDRHAEQKSVA